MKERGSPVAYETITVDVSDKIATITLNRPERMNACSLDMAGEINDALAEYDAPDAEQIIAGRQRLKRMLAALDALPPRARAVVILRRFENLTYPQIARRLGISVSAVEKHMTRAMTALRLDLLEGDH